MLIRNEEPLDAAAIEQTIRDAFRGADHSSGTEAQIVNALRRAGALAVSLVATDKGIVVGHIAISPVTMAEGDGWFGLAPVAVRPEWQHKGIGSRLITEALSRIREHGAAGCVVMGDPGIYGKFGFVHDPSVTYADAPPPYFQILSFGPERPSGPVRYHAGFDT